MGKEAALGYAAMAACIVIWVASSQFIKVIFDAEDFTRPVFLTYFTCSLYSLFLVAYLLPDCAGGGARGGARMTSSAQEEDLPEEELASMLALGDSSDTLASSAEGGSTPQLDLADHTEEELEFIVARVLEEVERVESNIAKDSAAAAAAAAAAGRGGGHDQRRDSAAGLGGHSTTADIVRAASPLCPLWFLSQLLFNLSLRWTSVSSNTILSSTSAVWTLLLSAFFAIERVTLPKCAAVALSMIGVFVVSYEDFLENRQKSRTAGDLVAVGSAMVYSLYSVTLRTRLGESSSVPMAKLTGFIGLGTLLFVWPLLLLLHLLSLEPFSLPSASVCASLAANGVFSMAAQYMWSYAVLFTSPTVATVGMSLTIPLAALSDKLLRTTNFTVLYAAGSMLVVSAFMIVTFEKTFTKHLVRAFPSLAGVINLT